MKESLKTKLLRTIRKWRIEVVTWIIRKAVRRLRKLRTLYVRPEGFRAYSWVYDETIDYIILKDVMARAKQEVHEVRKDVVT